MILLWLIIATLSYLFFSLSAFGDKLVLSGSSNQKSYVFYIGILNILALFLIPFAGFAIPDFISFLWIILDALVFMLSIYTMFTALEKFDVSSVVPTIGAIQPIFVFILTWIFFGPQLIKGVYLLAFLMLLAGGFMVSMGKTFTINGTYLKLILFSSLMFSCDYVFSKIVFLHMPFLQGLIWIRVFCFLIALALLFDKKLRKQIFEKKELDSKKMQLLVISTQSSAALAGILQNFAIALVPVGYLAIMNALRGLQYVFLFILIAGFSLLFPKIIKEDMSKKVIIQKVISMFFIVAGMAVLVLS